MSRPLVGSALTGLGDTRCLTEEHPPPRGSPLVPCGQWDGAGWAQSQNGTGERPKAEAWARSAWATCSPLVPPASWLLFLMLPLLAIMFASPQPIPATPGFSLSPTSSKACKSSVFGPASRHASLPLPWDPFLSSHPWAQRLFLLQGRLIRTSLIGNPQDPQSPG